ncbi:hypothetical protein B0O80DRAFT_457540 [Mortierella sp. GBAus27b]|nr:hypothetical protein B0O80DRAFT_457540 [Mortierella sp. GBAus27b]
MMTTQDRCVWICNDHYTEVVLRQLKDIIDISGGEYINSEVKVKVDTTYESLTTQFRDILTQLSHSQKPEGNFINCLNGIECLSIDFGRLSMTVHGISRGKVDDMTINIGRLSDLTMDDLDFIQQCHPVLVRIIRTPQKNDEDKLTMILQRNTMITELHIGCYVRRVFPVINLVISAREELLQIGGQSALRTVQVMKDGLIPCDINTVNDDSGLVTAMVSFTDGSTTFDIGSHVKLRKQLTDDDGEFLHQYGWSMKTLIVSESFGDRHAELLDAVTLERGSKIATLHLTLSALTSKGLDSIDRIIKRAPNPPTIRLFLDRLCEVDQLEKAIRLLERYKDRMVGLRLNGGLKTTWLPRITQVFPTRDMFPLLEELTIGGQVDSTRFANTSWEWILFMVSVPPQPLKGLKAFCLENTTFFYWHSIFSAIDLSALEVVSVKGCRIYGKGDLTLLAKRIADGESQSRPFRVLDLSNCHIFDPDDGPSMLRILREKAPQVEVVGLDQ